MKRGIAVVALAASMAAALALAPGCSSQDAEPEDADARFATEALFMNDVSVLFPLPKDAEKDLLLGPASVGAKGELLPEEVATAIPSLVAEGAARDDLRVVAGRLDPCFPGLGVEDPAGCKNQLRLVFQPVDATAAGETIRAKDAAVHAFYTMSREDLAALAREVLAAKHGARGTRAMALGPNPLMGEQGLAGAFAREVKDAFLRHAGRANLSRVTFMAREAIQRPSWKFGGFDVAEGTLTKMKIASLGETTEQTFTTFRRNGAAVPPPSSPDNLSLLFLASVASAAPAKEIQKAYVATLRIQNPALHSPDTIDCVSCHTATSARIWAEKNEQQRPDGIEALFVTPWNVALTLSPAVDRPDNLHAFGYLGRDASISQRTANETAVVADYINTKILGVR